MRDLRKSYDGVEAVRGLSFRVGRGEIVGLLGPNGAGKTTTVEILEGYRDRSGGEVSVLGHDPADGSTELRRRIGIVLQSGGFYPRVTVEEAVSAVRGLLPRPARRGRDGRARGPRGLVGRARQPALRRPAAPARPRSRARGRPGARVPRRADHRLRPRRAPHGMGGRAAPARARQDGAPHHALPRRGPGALGPRRDREGRPDRGGGPAARDRGRAARATGSPTTATAGRPSTRPTTRRRCSRS